MSPRPLPGPRRVDATAGPWPLHDAAAARQIEQAALAARPAPPLMEAAGLAVARLALALWPQALTAQVLAGPGNNGGDGFVAARHLHAAGWRVQVLFIGDATRQPADAAAALQRARDAGVPIEPWSPAAAARPGDAAIDALLGLGTNRAPQGPLADAIDACNATSAPVLAVDLPSGLHPDTGQPTGAAAVHAAATLALLTLKPGLFTGAGRDHAGATWFDDLGVAPAPSALQLAGPPPRHARPHAAHKGAFGDVVVVGGACGLVGAAWLAARAALAAGAGRVYLSLLDDTAAAIDPSHAELMARPRFWAETPLQLVAATTVCGCGGGTAVAEALPALLAHVSRIVLDADALNRIAGDHALGRLLAARASRGQASVITPHPLEAARLLGTGTRQVQADRLAAARRLAASYECCALLKGSGTAVAAAAGGVSINPTGNAALATPGSGDVLAGWIGGLWAQQPEAAPHVVAAAAAWMHGRVADVHAKAGLGGPLPAGALIDRIATLT
jgi:hydroxyethylthiazole kinase-like uncharacterized protein yjeF